MLLSVPSECSSCPFDLLPYLLLPFGAVFLFVAGGMVANNKEHGRLKVEIGLA